MDEEQKILKDRAKALSVPENTRSANLNSGREMLEFILSGERYAIGSSWVREALTLSEVTPIPGTPPLLSGLINVRGTIIPVVNLKILFNLKQEGIIASPKAITLQDKDYVVAFLVDAIYPAIHIPDSEIEPIPSNIDRAGSEHLLGITAGAIIIIDGNSLLKRIQSTLLKNQSSDK